MTISKTPLQVGLAAALVVGVGYAFYRETHPSGDRLTRAELFALVPPEFRRTPPEDPSAERRMREVVALADAKGPWPDRLGAILDAGPLRIPESESPAAQAERHAALGAFANRLERRFDAPADLRLPQLEAEGRLALRLAAALESAGGDIEDRGALARLERLFLLQPGYFVSGKAEGGRPLAIPTADEVRRHVAEAVARDFRRHVWRRLFRAAVDPGDLDPIVHEVLVDGIGAGTFDARETARLFVERATLEQAVCRKDDALNQAGLERLTRRIEATRLPAPSAGLLWRARFRWDLNRHPNTLGRLWFLRQRDWSPGSLVRGSIETWEGARRRDRAHHVERDHQDARRAQIEDRLRDLAAHDRPRQDEDAGPG